ncbi:putative G-type lectin S-receptor-like Serine/Threonine-kinase [Sesbania bispinosa]|nr:putative G-type lectin S-receptor-like Serine/Threonine-kinase [Sesbania bispinosa]
MSPANLSQKGENLFFSSKKELANAHKKGKESLEKKRKRTTQHGVQVDSEQGVAGRSAADTAQQGQHMLDSAQCNSTTFTKWRDILL